MQQYEPGKNAMQKISDLTAAVTNRETAPNDSLTQSPTSLPATWTAALFAKLAARYGHRWSSCYPNDLAKIAMVEWGSGLSGLSGEQIRHGLDSWKSDWPPSLPEFRRACTGSNDQHNTAAYKPFPKALPKSRAKPDVVAAEMEKMREALQ